MKNLGLKSLSLIIALLLYFFVHSQSNVSQRSFGAPVEIKNLPPKKMLLLPTVLQAQVTVRGPRFLLEDAFRSAPAFAVVLPSDVGSRYEAVLDEDSLGLSPALEVVKVEPSSLQLILDNRMVKSLPVTVEKSGRLQEHLRKVGEFVKPDTVEVVGSETEVREIEKVETFPVDLTDIAETTSQEVQLRVPWKYTRVKPSKVLVTMDVTSISVEKSFDSVPIELRFRSLAPVAIEPQSASFEVSGPAKVIKSLEKEGIVPYVAISEQVLSAGVAPVLLELPDGISLISIEPKQVTVRRVEPEAGAASPAPSVMPTSSVVEEGLKEGITQ